MKESRFRSLLKGITWRILATATTILIAYIITGEAIFAFQIGAFEFIAKLVIYYMHERIWQRVPKGTVRKWVSF